MKASLLIVDDELLQLQVLGDFLKSLDFLEVSAADNGQDALQLMAGKEFDIVLTDLKMPGMSGLELLAAVKKKNPETSVVILTGYGTVETTVQAMKLGAEDYLVKPFD